MLVTTLTCLVRLRTERFFEKAMFILGASVTDRTGLSTLKPLDGYAFGNEGALDNVGLLVLSTVLDRWLVNVVNGHVSLAKA